MNVIVSSSSEDQKYQAYPPAAYNQQYPGPNHVANNYTLDKDVREISPDRLESQFDGQDDIDYNVYLGIDTPIKIRHAFVKKTFSLIAISLGWAFGICLAVNLTTAREYFQTHAWMMIIAMIGMVVLSMVIICSPKFAQKSPINVILLMMYATCTGTCIAGVGCYTDVMDVLVPCMATTMFIALCCTAFAFQTKKDFTRDKFIPIIMVGLCSLMFFGMICWFIQLPGVQIVYGSLGVLLFSFLLVIDVQLIVGGNRSRQYSIDDYVVAALSVHADVINMFIYLLRIFQFME
eukprot:GHVH01000151.1.p1 GENE.GHVH01000151.1~~GHVH01000151.1.p1  ORF type:complete len:291 (+),score=27.71 GHVH01000151.1:66-938(+)